MRLRSRSVALLERPVVVVGAAVVLQWLTTLVVGLRAADVDVGAIELVNVLALGPLALTCAYIVARSIGGPALGAWTLLVWVALPWLAPLYTLASYDQTLRDDVLPLVVGLTSDEGYAEGVLILAAFALLAVRRREARAAGAIVAAAVGALWLTRAGSTGDLSLDTFQHNMALLREYFWSNRLLQWAPLAGVIAVGRRSLPLAAGLGAWLGGYVLFRAAQTGIAFENGEFFRAMLPALPAYILLTAAIPLLVPTLAVRLGPLAQRS
jgi:hypothetical protein